MTRYVNRWSALLAWAVLMSIVWAIFVPRGLSVGTLTLLGLTAPLALLAGSTVWGSYRPSPSVGRTGVATDAAPEAPAVRR